APRCGVQPGCVNCVTAGVTFTVGLGWIQPPETAAALPPGRGLGGAIYFFFLTAAIAFDTAALGMFTFGVGEMNPADAAAWARVAALGETNPVRTAGVNLGATMPLIPPSPPETTSGLVIASS